MAGHVRRPTLSKGEPKQTLRCSNAEALFQVPAGPFRRLYPQSTLGSLRAAWLYHMWNFFMLHLVSPGDLCLWDAAGRWIALNAKHWITGPTTRGKCLGRGNGSVERLARTGMTLEPVPAVQQTRICLNYTSNNVHIHVWSFKIFFKAVFKQIFSYFFRPFYISLNFLNSPTLFCLFTAFINCSKCNSFISMTYSVNTEQTIRTVAVGQINES